MLNIVANGPSGYNLTNSLRFRRSASAYLNRTPASAGNRQVMTYSFWVKRGFVGSLTSDDYCPISAYTDASNLAVIYFNSSNSQSLDVFFKVAGTNYAVTTSQRFADPSAWYHIVIAIDTTQATASNRTKIYVNGSQVTAFSAASYVPQNSNLAVNNNVAQYFGTQYVSSSYFDGYLAEVNFIDGQALTPSSFGSTNTLTGVWQPAQYTGTYGTNGFYLKFSDIALTSGSNAGLGKDFSGNGNYWNTNNISVTAGTTYDAMTDVPTLTSATVANYAVMSPIMAGSITVTDGNLSVQKVGASYGNTNSTIAFPTSGKYYFEVTIVSGTSGNNQQMGMGTQGGSYYFVLDCYYSGSLIRKVADGVATTGYGTASVGTIIGVAVDADNGKAYLAINNTWIDSSSPTGGTGGYSMTAGQVYSGFFQAYNSGVSAYNFGQRPFSYTPPTGFVALNTFNLPNSTIVKGNTVMDATLWTGNASNPQTITNAAGFKPDLVWWKVRSNGIYYNQLADSVRGATKSLYSNVTAAEETNAINGYATAFNSNGFSVTAGSTSGGSVNASGSTYVGWQWQAGQGSTSSNTSGSITSTVSVNTTAGFSVVTWTGNGTVGATVGHSLGVAPKMVIMKRINGATNWQVWITGFNATTFLFLQSTNAVSTAENYFNSTLPSSTLLTLSANSEVNASGGTYVALCWAEIAGFSKFGSYTGNGSTDGPFVYLGFRPKFVITKRTDSATNSNWEIHDSSRNTYNVANLALYPNTADAEGSQDDMDFLSNGFKLRYASANTQTNINGGTYIYAAFAENPFKNALAR